MTSGPGPSKGPGIDPGSRLPLGPAATITTAPRGRRPGSPPPPGGKKTDPRRPHGSEDPGEYLLLLAITISLGLHVLLWLVMHNRLLFEINEQYLTKAPPTLRVERLPRDFQTPDLPAMPTHIVENDGAGDPTGSSVGGVSISDLAPTAIARASQSILSQAYGPPAAPAASGSALRLNQSVEGPPAVGDPNQVFVPKVQLPPSVSTIGAVTVPLSVPFNGPGTGSGTRGSGTGSDAADANLALANVGARTGLNPQPQRLPDSTRRESLDQRVMDLPLAPPPLDLSLVARDASTKLNVPEHLDNDFDYVVTKFIPSTKRGFFGGLESPLGTDPRGYFRVDITGKRSLRRLRTMPKDTVFLVDVSGSVPQEWVDQVVRGVKDSLASFNPGDRFNIVFFKDRPLLFSPTQIQPYNDQTAAAADKFLTGAKSGGDTDVNQALSRLLVRDVATERVYNLILISDGRPTRGVMDTRELINLVTRDNDLNASIYAISVGIEQNRTLLEFLTYRNKGFCVYVDKIENAASSIRDLSSRLRYPIMKDIRYIVGGMGGDDIYPRDLPNIHQGESFQVFGRFDKATPFTMRLTGHNGAQTLDMTFSRNLADAEIGPEQIAYDWALFKLHNLYNQIIRAGETKELRDAIDDLRKVYKLKTLY